MRFPFFASTCVAAALISGCASSERQLVLDPVGPRLSDEKTDDRSGSLVVYSALSIDMPTNRRPEHARHTDYKIFSPEGQLLQVVENDYGDSWDGPKEVRLGAGKYRIVAEAARYGMVTVPVVIAPHQTTRVDLEGGLRPVVEKGTLTEENAVRLPNGQVVGWRAQPEPSDQVHLGANLAK